MVLYIVLAVLAIGLIVSYLKGVKQAQPWGQPVLVLCTIGIIAVVAVKVLSRGEGATSSGIGSLISATDSNAAKLIGEQLKDEVPAGSRVFMLTHLGPGGTGYGPVMGTWLKGLSDGLGYSVELSGSYGPTSGADPQAVSAAMEGVEFDAVVSTDGLPADPETLSIFQEPEPPPFGVYFRTAPADLSFLRPLLSDGLVDVAVVNQGGKLHVFTPSNLP